MTPADPHDDARHRRLRDLLDGLGLLAHAHRQRGQPDGAAGETDADGVEDRPVEPVQADLVDLVQLEGRGGHGRGDPAGRPDQREVADAAQQLVAGRPG